jgi:hypothetical protein
VTVESAKVAPQAISSISVIESGPTEESASQESQPLSVSQSSSELEHAR